MPEWRTFGQPRWLYRHFAVIAPALLAAAAAMIASIAIVVKRVYDRAFRVGYKPNGPVSTARVTYLSEYEIGLSSGSSRVPELIDGERWGIEGRKATGM